MTPNPAGATYSSSLTGGPGAGSYTVTATATSPYSGSGSATLTITPAPTTFSLSATAFTYNGGVQGPTVVASPSGATFTTGGTLSATAAGTYTATATATGNYSGANTTLTWTIAKAGQTIEFPAPAAQTFSTPLVLSATASSGLPVSFVVAAGPASLSGNTATFTGTGSVTITANQAGDANRAAAPAVSRSFTVNSCPVSFSLNRTSFTATGSAQGPVVVASPGAATFTTGGTLSATAVGTYTASATATGNYSGSNTTLVWAIAAAGQVPPAVPFNLQALGGSTKVTLSWSSSGTEIARYEIRRGGVLLGSVPAGTLAYVDATVTPSSSYNYAVRAVGTNGLSSDDRTVTVTTVAPLEVFAPTR